MKSVFKLTLLLSFICIVMTANAQTILHDVRPGDTFESIAAKYNVGLDALRQANPYIQKCFVGAQLQIPSGMAESVASVQTASSVQTVTSIQTESPKTDNVVASAKPVKTVEETIDPYVLMYEGVSLIQSGYYSKAKKVFAKVLKLEDMPEAYYYRGLCNYRMQRWKPAYNDFYVAKTSSGIDAKMKADASDLYQFTYSKHHEKVEKRKEAWATVGEIVGTTLLAVGAVALGVATEAMYGGSSYDTTYSSASSFYSTPSNTYGAEMPSGISSMSTTQFSNYIDSQLIDLMQMTIAQVEQQNMAEYLQMTNGGQTMSYDQWISIKAQAMSNVNLDTSPAPGTAEYYQEREQDRIDVLNRAVGEQCMTCKGTGKCLACNGTKVAHGFGNSYVCTVCDESGVCPTCKGTKVASWNR